MTFFKKKKKKITPWELISHLQACGERQEVSAVAAGIHGFAYLRRDEKTSLAELENTYFIQDNRCIQGSSSLFPLTQKLKSSVNTRAGDESQLERGQEQRTVTRDRRFLCVWGGCTWLYLLVSSAHLRSNLALQPAGTQKTTYGPPTDFSS